MAHYVLDTGIVLGLIRGAGYAAYVRKRFSPSIPPNMASLSIVTVAEMRALALRRNWGDQKRAALDGLLRSTPIVDIRHDSVVNLFASIDAFNHGKHPTHKLTGSSRAMGDNDIWIAATAATMKATLLTADRDFDHLNGTFLDVVYIDQNLTETDAK